MTRCSFCTSTHGKLRYAVQGIKRGSDGMIFFAKRKIFACIICYDKIVGCWLSCSHGLRRSKNVLKELSKIKGFGAKKSIDALLLMQIRSERREKMGIITA